MFETDVFDCFLEKGTLNQTWALAVFFNFFNNKNDIFYQVNLTGG